MEDFGTQLIRQMERLLEERNGAGIRRVSGPVRLRTGPPGGIPGSAEHPPAQRRYAPRPVPGRMPGGLPEGLRERMDLARLDLREAGDLEAILHQLFFLTGGALMRSAGPGGPEAAGPDWSAGWTYSAGARKSRPPRLPGSAAEAI